MPDLAMLDYFYGDEAEQFTFYRIPKVLFTDPSYRRISSDAKILYGLTLTALGFNGNDSAFIILVLAVISLVTGLIFGISGILSSRKK